ncbi:MAG: TetR/AcrR family transcriptional regulator [Pseudomonadales bacterium]
MPTIAEPVARETLGKQAAKSKHTQDNIINAVIVLIKEGGFAAASSSKIAQKAGVSWGAVQHHFGSKHEILEAIMLRSQQHFTATLNAEQFYTGTLGQRVDRFVDTAWAHYQGAEYMAALEILLATRAQQEQSSAMSIEKNQAQAQLHLWRSIFPEATNSDEQLLDDIQIVHCMLIGATIQRVLESQSLEAGNYLRRVKQILLALLTEK